jgi:quercetin dioxygenase-like cupin family protein
MMAAAPTIRIGDLELKFLIDEKHGEGNVIAFEFKVPPNARVPAPHYHKLVDETVYGLEGVLTTTLDGKTVEIMPGDCLFIPRGAVHHHANPKAEMARVLCFLTPGSIGRRYFEEIAEVVNVPGKPDLAKVKDIMLRHGLVPA